MAAQTRVTPEDYLKTSFAGLDREYVDGEVVERGMPTYSHSKSNEAPSGAGLRF